MNDPETLVATLKFGACIAFIAASLYRITSRSERSGFHLLPSTALEWTHYWFRILILGVLSWMLFFLSIDNGDRLLAFSAVLLFGRSMAFWLIESLAWIVERLADAFRSTVLKVKRAIRWHHLRRTARRYRWFLLFISVLGGCGIGYTVYHFTPKLYHSRGLIEVLLPEDLNGDSLYRL